MTVDRGQRILLAIGWAGTALAAAAAGRFASFDPRWDRLLLWAGMAGALGVLLYLAAQTRAILDSTSQGKTTRRSRRAALLAGAFVLLAALNVLATRYSLRWDLTTNDVHALSDQTQDILRRLDTRVRVRVFGRQEDLSGYRDRLTEYEKASSNVMVDYVDVDERPELVRQYDVDAYGTVVLEYGNRSARTSANSEQELTGALNAVLEGTAWKAYFTAGHAERDTDSTERAGFSEVAAALRRANFVVQEINLAQVESEVPPDATVVVVAGPRADFFRAEVDGLRRYLDRGGKVLFLIDPFEDLKRYITESGTALFMMDPGSAEATAGLDNLIGLIRDWKIELGDDVIVDASGMGQFLGTDASVPVVSTYPPHEITRGLESLTAFPMARSVTPVSGGEVGGEVVPAVFLETGPQAWAESDIAQLTSGTPSMDLAAGDRPGPVSLGVAVSAPVAPSSVPPPGTVQGDTRPFSSDTRLVVMGDSDFVANTSANIPGNAELFLDVVRWLSQQEAVVTIPVRQFDERQLAITGSQRRALSWLAVFVLPLMLASCGFYLSGRRR